MNNYTTILIIVSVFAAIAIIALVLMQQSKGDMGSAFGGGGSQSMFGSRGSANFLSRSTSIMVAVLFASCLALAYTYAKRNAEADTVDTIIVDETSEVPTIDSSVESAPTESDVPVIDISEASAELTDSVDGAIEEAADDAAQQIEETVEETAPVPE